jgi:hypothetical protein
MMFDPDPLVRMAVADRLDSIQLLALAADEDLRVRYVVADRGDEAVLTKLCQDPDPEVRQRARARKTQQREE